MKFRSTLLFFVLLTLFSSAQDGTIDSTFGANGIITFEIRDDNYVRDMTFLEDECFITAGEYYIRNNTPYKPQLYFSKHNRNGSFDPVFGVNGLIDSLRDSSGSITKIKILSDGNILAMDCGLRSKLIKLDKDGLLYDSFGENGIAESPNSIVFDVLQDGRIITAGTYFDGTYGFFNLACYHADGTTDLSFGNNGSIYYDVSGDRYEYVSEIKIPGGNKILVAGAAFNVGNGLQEKAIVAQYNIDGTPDTTFGINGIAIIPVGDAGGFGTFRCMDIQSDGKILLGGTADMHFPGNYTAGRGFITRLNSNGSIDTSFADYGILTPGDFNSVHKTYISIEQLPDKNIIAAGGLYSSPQSYGSCIKLDSTGNLVPDFGLNGIFDTKMNYSRVNGFAKVKMRSDGKIFVCGGQWDNPNSHRESVIVMCLKNTLITNSVDDDKITVYPNPSNGNFTISGINRNSTIKLFSILGQEMSFTKTLFEENKIKLQTSISSGIYFINVSGSQTMTKRIIIY